MAPMAVIALGGNALSPAGGSGRYDEQLAQATKMAASIAELADDGWQIVVVHGNGPQVGALAFEQSFQHERVARFVAPQPLFSLGAMTQGQIGSLLVLALHQQLGESVPVVSVVSHVVVDADDPSFSSPTKPIGPFFTGADADRLRRERSWTMVEDSGRGYRRVVPSPTPRTVLEASSIQRLVHGGALVIACGGGGVPVVARDRGYIGVEAVIDKDLVASRLALTLGADTVALVTGVTNVQLDFGTAEQRPLCELDVDTADRYLQAGQFPAGSMGPKMEASIAFVRDGGRMAVITTAERLVSTMSPHRSPADAPIGTRIVSSMSPSRRS